MTRRLRLSCVESLLSRDRLLEPVPQEQLFGQKESHADLAYCSDDKITLCPNLCRRSRVIEDLTHQRFEQLPGQTLDRWNDCLLLDQRPAIAEIYWRD